MTDLPPLTLYHGWLSSASRRVRLFLEEKGLRYDSVAIDMSRQEHHAPEYLAMNPNGVVPALVVGPGRSLYESSTICEYLEEICPQPPLLPADPYDRAVMRNFVRWIDDKCLPNLLILNWSIALQPVASGWDDDELRQKLQRIPNADRREAWARIARRPYTDDEKTEALTKLLQLAHRMEQMLVDADWLIADRYSLADIAAVPFIARIDELAPHALAKQTHPHVDAWWQRVQQRPAFARARFERFDDALRKRNAG